jgi:hypothetical protein
MGYVSSKANADFWMKKHKDGHYEYIANYVDDVISFSKDPMSVIDKLKKDYMLKGVGEPKYYLGGNVDPLDTTWKDDHVSLALSDCTYVKNVAERFETVFGTELRQQKTPMSEHYHPECDDTPLLDNRGAAIYQGSIGSANWAMTLGCFDIQYTTQMMSCFSMATRQGHLDAMKRVLGYLKKFKKVKSSWTPVIVTTPSSRSQTMTIGRNSTQMPLKNYHTTCQPCLERKHESPYTLMQTMLMTPSLGDL